jgi:GT2 family glycosyltransferase
VRAAGTGRRFRPNSQASKGLRAGQCYHPNLLATVVIPTLHGGESLLRCIRALEAQTIDDFEVVIVDNSGHGAAREASESWLVRLIENVGNVGFGAAINQGAADSEAEYICTLNDDAYPAPEWLESLTGAAESDASIGMCASLILLHGDADAVDSAGFGIYSDGTTKQIGHRQPAAGFSSRRESLMPSGCAGLYRHSMLRQIGGFDDEYFLYGEDSDVGLRGQLAGWKCLFEPAAIVAHDYSGSAGRASRLKAFYVERNRLCTLIKLFPIGMIAVAPFYALARYWAHWRAVSRGEGLAGEFGIEQSPLQLVLIVMQAHWAALIRLPRLWRIRNRFGAQRKLSSSQFRALIQQHRMTAHEIARQ